MKDMEPAVGSSDYGKDEDMAEVIDKLMTMTYWISVLPYQALLKKHEAITTDIEAFKTTIDSLSAQSKSCKVSINF